MYISLKAFPQRSFRTKQHLDVKFIDFEILGKKDKMIKTNGKKGPCDTLIACHMEWTGQHLDQHGNTTGYHMDMFVDMTG